MLARRRRWRSSGTWPRRWRSTMPTGSTRGEALRRLALLGLGMPAASALLAACGGDGEPARPPPPVRARRPPPPRRWRPRRSPSPARRADRPGRLGGGRPAARGGAGHPREPRPQRPHPLGRRPAGRQRLLGAGHRPALGRGRDRRPWRRGRGHGRALQRPQERFVADMRAGLDELERRAPDQKLGAIGFCFGGGMTWLLLASVSRAWPRRRRSTARFPRAPTSPARPTRPSSASTPSRTTA